MDDERRIRVGLLGAGGIGETHFEALRRVGGVDVVALCDINEKACRAYADRHDVRRIYADWRQLIDDVEVEVVEICTPNYHHYPQVMYALERGKHVVVDKPLGINVTQTGEMLRLAVEKRLAHAITYNHRFLPLVFHMREMVRRGDLGKITLIKAHTLGDFMMAINEIAPGHWRTKPETVGLSKTMSTMGGHLLDLLYFISGQRVRSVFADFVYVDPKTPPIEFDGEESVPGTTGQMEDHANLLLRFDDGVKGSVVLSEAAPGHKVELFLEIIGTKSCVAWNLQKINEIWIGHRTEPNGLLYKGYDLLYPEAQAVAAPPDWGQDGFSESFRQLSASVYQHIRDKKYQDPHVRPDFADFHDGHYMEHVMRSMLRSSRLETWQEVGYTGP